MTSNAKATTAPRSKILRGKTGCVCCRLRRKKCDESKPTCRACERNALICTWPEKISRPTGQIGPVSPRTRDHTSSKGGTQIGLSSSQGFIQEGDTTIPPWLPVRPTDLISEHVSPTSLSLNYTDFLSLEVLTHPQSRNLFEYYFYRTAKIMSPCQESNPFLDQVLPVAMANELVMQSLLVLGGIHHAEASLLEVCSVTWTHYAQAIKGLKVNLTKFDAGDDTLVVPLLIATLVLFFVETTRGNTNHGALAHLKAYRHLLFSALQLPSSRLDDEVRTFFVEIYSFLIVVSEISFGEDSNGWILEDASFLLPLISVKGRNPGFICGSAHSLFQLIPQASALVRRRITEQTNLGSTSWETVSAFLSMRSTVQRWESQATNSADIICGKLYQQAILIYLETCFGAFDTIGTVAFFEYSTAVQQAFETSMSLLESVPIDSAASTTFCWPLVVIGACAMTSQHQTTIYKRLMDISDHLGINHARRAAELLEIVWKKHHTSQRSPLILSQIMEEQSKAVYFV